jgi:hypothetical protein
MFLDGDIGHRGVIPVTEIRPNPRRSTTGVRFCAKGSATEVAPYSVGGKG